MLNFYQCLRLPKHGLCCYSCRTEVKQIMRHPVEASPTGMQISPWSFLGHRFHSHLTYSLESNPVNLYPFESPTSSSTSYLETEKHAVHTTEAEIIDKLVTEEDPATQIKTNDLVNNFFSIHDYDGVPGCMTISYGNEEYVSFSDLEDDDDEPTAALRSKTRRL